MTTIVIDSKNHKVYADTRGTLVEDVTSLNISFKFPFFKIKKENEKVYLDCTEKLTRLGNTLISGSGSLEVLSKFATRIKEGKFFTPNNFIMKLHYNPSVTEVICSKYCNGKTQSISHTLQSKHLIGKYYLMINEKKKITKDYYTSGSGGQYMAGYLMASEDVFDAYEAVKKCDTGTGGKTVCINLKN